MIDRIKTKAIDATKDLCSEKGITQTLDNLESLIEPVPVPIVSDLVERAESQFAGMAYSHPHFDFSVVYELTNLIKELEIKLRDETAYNESLEILHNRLEHYESALKRIGDPHLISDVSVEEQNQARIKYALKALEEK